MPDSPMAQHGLQMLRNGYAVLPIMPGSDVPGSYYAPPGDGWLPMRDWTSFGPEPASERMVTKWGAFPDAGVGIACGNVTAVSINILDDKLAREVVDIFQRVLGETPLVQHDWWSKQVLVYATAGRIKKKNVGPVTLLCEGEQFTAFATHPEAKYRYWWRRLSPSDVPVSHLPVVDEQRVSAAFAEVDALLTPIWKPHQSSALDIKKQYGKHGDLHGHVMPGGATVVRFFGNTKGSEHQRDKDDGNPGWWLQCPCGMREWVEPSYRIVRGTPAKCCPTDGVTKHPLYKVWVGIKTRTENPNSPSYAEYGGRGIDFEPEMSRCFWRFVEHIGDRPSPKHSVDRRDNSKGYIYGNMRWATKEQQIRNRRTTTWVWLDDKMTFVPFSVLRAKLEVGEIADAHHTMIGDDKMALNACYEMYRRLGIDDDLDDPAVTYRARDPERYDRIWGEYTFIGPRDPRVGPKLPQAWTEARMEASRMKKLWDAETEELMNSASIRKEGWKPKFIVNARLESDPPTERMTILDALKLVLKGGTVEMVVEPERAEYLWWNIANRAWFDVMDYLNIGAMPASARLGGWMQGEAEMLARIMFGLSDNPNEELIATAIDALKDVPRMPANATKLRRTLYHGWLENGRYDCRFFVSHPKVGTLVMYIPELLRPALRCSGFNLTPVRRGDETAMTFNKPLGEAGA